MEGVLVLFLSRLSNSVFEEQPLLLNEKVAQEVLAVANFCGNEKKGDIFYAFCTLCGATIRTVALFKFEINVRSGIEALASYSVCCRFFENNFILSFLFSILESA